MLGEHGARNEGPAGRPTAPHGAGQCREAEAHCGEILGVEVVAHRDPDGRETRKRQHRRGLPPLATSSGGAQKGGDPRQQDQPRCQRDPQRRFRRACSGGPGGDGGIGVLAGRAELGPRGKRHRAGTADVRQCSNGSRHQRVQRRHQRFVGFGDRREGTGQLPVLDRPRGVDGFRCVHRSRTAGRGDDPGKEGGGDDVGEEALPGGRGRCRGGRPTRSGGVETASSTGVGPSAGGASTASMADRSAGDDARLNPRWDPRTPLRRKL